MRSITTVRSGETIFGIVLAAGFAVAAIHVALGLYHLAAIAILATGAGVLTMATDHISAVARRLRTDLKALAHITPGKGAVTLRAIRSDGRCAWGYREDDMWTIGKDGSVSPSLCRAAASAVAPLLRSLDPASSPISGVDCPCPLANRQVTFAFAGGSP